MERATLGRPKPRTWRPTRSKGQCFLRDEQVIERIAEAIGPNEGETLLEIGGGHGELTLPLVRRGARVISIEADKTLAPKLEKIESVEVVQQDALKVDFGALLDTHAAGERVRACGNLPYSVASPILLRLLTHRERFSEMTLMFQDEVASRLTARPGTKAYGFLTVVAQQAARVRLLFRISREAFRPRPRVVSALVRFDIRHDDAPDIGDERTFRALVHALLAHRRKTIANNVKQLREGPIARDALFEALDALEIDPKRRAETLTVETFAELSRIIASPA